MLKFVEIYISDLIRHPRRGPVARCVHLFLRGLSIIYRVAVACRNFAFNKGFLKSYSASLPVISVGNIVAGGTGKTPTAILLARTFALKAQVAVLSRGYRGQVKDLAVAWDRGRNLTGPRVCGDEPYLIGEKCPDARVIVGRNRRQAAEMARQLGAELILLDDGMQHRQLGRDFEVVVVDGRDPFGQGRFLPAGFLRESKKALGRADLLVVNHGSERVKKLLGAYCSAPQVITKMEIVAAYQGANGEEISLKGRKVGVFCGIANPDRFVETLEWAGAEVVALMKTADHVRINERLLQKFSDRCREGGATALLCTEKDKVKFTTFPSCSLPVGWAEAHLALVDEESRRNFEAFVDRVAHCLCTGRDSKIEGSGTDFFYQARCGDG